MKETEMHDGLPDREIRILIAHDIRTTIQMEAENKQKTTQYDVEHLWDYVIQDCKNAIEFHQKRLKIAELRKGLDAVLALRGWEEHDISDENISIEPGQKYYLSFIGTKAEHKALLKKLYPKKK
jgi:hypothetical protein